MPNIPQVIAKAATTIAVVLRLVFIKRAESTTNLKDSFENSHTFFVSRVIV
jgi:hypothetical protein